MTVPRYGLFEQIREVAGAPRNGYRDVEAHALIRCPDGSERRIPLFWDGGDAFGVRISPDAAGRWSYRVESALSGLNGLEGRFECVASDLRGGLQPMGGYHFQRQDGTPVWFFGDTAWRAFATDPEKRLDRAALFHYVDVRSSQGFNYVHVDLMGSGGIASREAIFDSFDQEIIRPDFFHEVDERLRHMNAAGITVGIVLAWHRGVPAWECFRSDQARLRFTRYVVARYSAFNVVFVVAGEWDQIAAEEGRPVFQRIGRHIAAWDPHGRMRGIHPCRRRSTEEFAEDDWCSFGDYQQRYEAPDDRESTPRERVALHEALLRTRVHSKPVVNGEYAYYLREMKGPHDYRRQGGGVDKPHSHTRASFRRATWALAMAGGYFVTGFGTTYFGGWRNLGPFDVDDTKNDPAEEDLVRLRELFEGLQWWKLEPADGKVRGSNEGGGCYALAGQGTCLVYCEEQDAVLIDNALSAARSCRRYDPRTGSWQQVATEHGEREARLTCPDRQDWAFVLQ